MANHDFYKDYEIWKEWDKPFEYSQDEAEYFSGETRELNLKDAEILEIGFGSGNFLAWARDQGARLAGTETNKSMVEAIASFDVEIIPAAIETVSEQHINRFDAIVAFDVFEHLTLDEIFRHCQACVSMLKPGGHLILRFPNGQSPFGLPPQHGDPTHITALSRSIVESLTQGMGLDVIRYAPSFRARGQSLSKRIVRIFRHAFRDLIAISLNAIFAINIPWDPVVVLVLRANDSKPADRQN